MEDEDSNGFSWSSASNWIISHGSLEKCVSFESSISTIDEDERPHPRDLVLKPPKQDSGPCEITITFQQRHEVCQVYVKSTARIFEIYYVPDQHSGSEYLCTVRCGVAVKEDEVLCVDDIGEATSEHSEGTGGKGKSNCSNNSSCEDGWVEVKNLESAAGCNTENPLLKKIDGNDDRITQDFFEATAEITDASPCVSLTLRLLSLQTKEFVHIEEIYIFADPVEPDSMDLQLDSPKNSAGSSLLAMLVPSIMKISKSSMCSGQDGNISDIRGRQDCRDGELKESEPVGPKRWNTMQQQEHCSMTDSREVKTWVPHENEAETQIKPGTQIPKLVSEEKKSTVEYLEKMLTQLDQLDARMGRIEAFCSKFEESMLKPLNGMESRFNRLEEKLNALTMINFQSVSPNICSRIVSPKFSCEKTGSSSLHDENNNDINDLSALESVNTTQLEKMSAPINDSGENPQRCPSLVVTAPEFSSEEDNSCQQLSEPERKDCTEEKPSVSVNDAIASALAAFLSSTCKLNPCTRIKAPTFVSEDTDDEESGLPSARVLPGAVEKSCLNFQRTDGTQNTEDFISKGSFSSLVNNPTKVLASCGQLEDSAIKFEENITDSLEDDSTTFKSHKVSPSMRIKAPDFINEDSDNNEESGLPSIRVVSREAENSSLNCHGNDEDSISTPGFQSEIDRTSQVLPSAEFEDLSIVKDENIETDTENDSACVCIGHEVMASDELNKDCIEVNHKDMCLKETIAQCDRLIQGSTDSLKEDSINTQLCEEQEIKDTAEDTVAGTTANKDHTAGIELQNVGQSVEEPGTELEEKPQFMLDFKFPILDVKFVSQKDWASGKPLEALLGEAPQTEVQFCGGEDAEGVGYGSQNRLLQVGEGLLVEFEDHTAESYPSGSEVMPDPSASSQGGRFLWLL